MLSVGVRVEGERELGQQIGILTGIANDCPNIFWEEFWELQQNADDM